MIVCRCDIPYNHVINALLLKEHVRRELSKWNVGTQLQSVFALQSVGEPAISLIRRGAVTSKVLREQAEMLNLVTSTEQHCTASELTRAHLSSPDPAWCCSKCLLSPLS